MKSKSAVKAVRDVRSIPWQAYALPDDGRKQRQNCNERRALAVHLSSYANEDGTSIRCSEYTMARELGKSRRQIVYRIKDLKTLEFLCDDGWYVNGVDSRGREIKTRRRKLIISKMLQAAGRLNGASDAQDTSGSDAQDTPECCAILEPVMRKIGGSDAQDRTSAQPAFGPASQPPTHTATKSKTVGVSEEDAYNQVMKHLHAEMEGSQFKTGEGKKLRQLISQNGWRKVATAAYLYARVQNFFHGQSYRWTGFLDAPAKWLENSTLHMMQEITCTDEELNYIREQATKRAADNAAADAAPGIAAARAVAAMPKPAANGVDDFLEEFINRESDIQRQIKEQQAADYARLTAPPPVQPGDGMDLDELMTPD